MGAKHKAKNDEINFFPHISAKDVSKILRLLDQFLLFFALAPCSS
jgi:hypothetical protein